MHNHHLKPVLWWLIQVSITPGSEGRRWRSGEEQDTACYGVTAHKMLIKYERKMQTSQWGDQAGANVTRSRSVSVVVGWDGCTVKGTAPLWGLPANNTQPESGHEEILEDPGWGNATEGKACTL